MAFDKFSLNFKVLFSVAVSCLICGAISLSVAMYYNDVEFRRGLVGKAQIIHGRLDVAARYVANQGGLKPMVEKYKQMYTTSDQLTAEDKNTILQQVPIYAAMKIGLENAEKENYQFRVFSDEPRNPDNKATAKELVIFQKFKDDPTLKEIVEDVDGDVTVYRPVHLKNSHGCNTCHGNPRTSPWGNGKDILGYQMENWKDGKLHGVFAVRSNVDQVHAAETAAGMTSSTPYLVSFILLGGFIALFLSWLMLRRPINSMRDVAQELSAVEEQLSSTSSQLSSNSNALSESSGRQASAIQETTASLEEITAMVQKTTENAQATAKTSAQSKDKAEEGKGVVGEMAKSMDEIDQSNKMIMQQVDDGNAKMNEILTVIEEISNKTKVINEIVFQTKLLSFNASVEAARAGEAGKGFAVVAQEVGNLAEMSGDAAKEIGDMLDASFKKVEVIVKETKDKVEDLIEQGNKRVERGVATARECGAVLDEILTNVSESTRMAGEISTANQEQSQGIGEINKAMTELDAVTRENSTMSSESSQSAESVFEQARNLKAAVSSLMTTLEGVNNAARAASHSYEKTSSTPTNTIPFTVRDKKESAEAPAASYKLAAGGESIPDCDSPDFEDF
jgi:methyl-accepting chemotaxis protein